MTLTIYLLLILAVATTFAYFRGRKKNQWIAGWIARSLEEVLKPRDTNYVNIGGTIGYNFTHQLSKPFTQAKGTYTLQPRQSLLYLPLSLLIAGRDRFYMNLFIKGKLPGEGHILRKDYLRKMRTTITGMDKMSRAEKELGGAVYVLLWDRPEMEEKLTAFLEKGIRGPEFLHFCCYRDNSTFFLHLQPRKEEGFRAALQAAWKHLSIFLPKGGNHEEPAERNHESGDDPEN